MANVLEAHWPALVAGDFFTTEVFTMRELVTVYTAFVIELESRQVRVVGSTRYPDEAFVVQALRSLTNGVDDILRRGRGADLRWDPHLSGTVTAFLEREGVRILRTPAHAPNSNCNAYAERCARHEGAERRSVM